MAADDSAAIPGSETKRRLFARFLRFGFLAWGGPVAQIALIRHELVDRERWVSSERFNRTLAVYQALPGPEAHELCVYFGYLAHGRVGAILAGLGFMLPGTVLVIALAWLYVHVGLSTAALAGLFAGFQPAVAALIVRAVVKIGRHALTHPWLWVVAVGAGIAEALNVPFWMSLAFAGASHAFVARRWVVSTFVVAAAFAAGVALTADPGAITRTSTEAAGGVQPSLVSLLEMGLRAGLLTFGGAYTAIPFVRGDAVGRTGWMTDGQFLDALALSGILPAPLIIFGTFVGYVGGGLDGALVVTLAIFLPAFSFTLIGHRHLERLVREPATHALLDGIAAGVVGLIAVTAVRLLPSAIPDVTAGVIFTAVLVVVTAWRARLSLPVAVLGAGAAGLLLEELGP